MLKKARVLAPTPENLRLAAARLRASDIVAMPTETVYGLAANAFDETALAKVFAVKERPTFDPLIVHVSGRLLGESRDDRVPREVTMALARAELIDETKLSAKARTQLERLARAFWPGPLTLVLPKHSRVPDLATGGLPTVGVRLPRHPVARALIDTAGLPLAAPSANRFGRISPTAAKHVLDELGDRIDIILEGGEAEVGLESSVVAVAPADGALTLLRPGGVAQEELERVAQAPVLTAAEPYAQTLARQAPGFASPGMLKTHYAPSKGLQLLPASFGDLSDEELKKALSEPLAEAERTQAPAQVGLLLLAGNPQEVAARLRRLSSRLEPEVHALSLNGELELVARGLFAALRTLDQSSRATWLYAEPGQNLTGLGFAVADRLRRAASRGMPCLSKAGPRIKDR